MLAKKENKEPLNVCTLMQHITKQYISSDVYSLSLN
jgi:hypothetical protein